MGVLRRVLICCEEMVGVLGRKREASLSLPLAQGEDGLIMDRLC